MIAWIAVGAVLASLSINFVLCSEEKPIEYLCAKSNIEYIQTNHGLAPLLDIDGNPVRCGDTGLERKEYQD